MFQQTKVFQQTKRATIGALLAGALVAGSGAALAGQEVTGAHAASRVAAAPHPALTKALRALARRRLQATVLTVQSVSGTTIAATTRAGIPITVDTIAGGARATTFTEAGATVSISAVQPNEHIRVRGTYNRVDRTAQATRVIIVVPSVAGVVTGVSGSTITLTDRNAVQHTISLGSARVEELGKSVPMSTIAPGSLVTVQLDPTNSSTVLRVVIHVPRFAGTIGNASGSTFTLTTAAGKTYTVTTTSSTAIAAPKARGAKATATPAPAIANGERAIVQGTVNGTNVTALRITVWQPKAKASTGSTTGQSA